MKNYVSSGNRLPLTAPYVVASGGGMKVGTIFAVATTDAAQSAAVEGITTGVFDLAKAATITFSAGDAVYWDDTNKVVTSTSSGNTKIGAAILSAASADTTARVRLNGTF